MSTWRDEGGHLGRSFQSVLEFVFRNFLKPSRETLPHNLVRMTISPGTRSRLRTEPLDGPGRPRPRVEERKVRRQRRVSNLQTGTWTRIADLGRLTTV